MNLKTLFIITAIIAAFFGVGLIFAPEAIQKPYGIHTEQAVASATMARFFGATNLGFAILFWFMRDAASSEAKTAVVRALSLAFVVGFLVSLYEQISGTFGPLGWSTVALYGMFCAAYGYFGFRKGAAET